MSGSQMQSYRVIFQLDLAHEFYGESHIPLKVVEAEPKEFARSGMMLKRRGQRIMLIAPDDVARPDIVQLDLVAMDTELPQITLGADWHHLVQVKIKDSPNDFQFSELAVLEQEMGHGGGVPRVCRLEIRIDKTKMGQARLVFSATEALWAYHVTNAEKRQDLEVVDTRGAVQFAPQDPIVLPNGKTAQILRSLEPLPARARPDQKFALQASGPFGPEILIPVLPGAGAVFKPTPEPNARHSLQADIFVTL